MLGLVGEFAVFPGDGRIVLGWRGVLGSKERQERVHSLVLLEELQDWPAQLLLQTLDHGNEFARDF